MDNKPYNDRQFSIKRYMSDYYTLREEDFYPPSDNRIVQSGVTSIYGGDNFADYCEYFFDLCEEEGYYDWLIKIKI